jgi:two-component system cell cycle sensor histidine kinase/response regulator CckA
MSVDGPPIALGLTAPPAILIVDDRADVRRFIRTTLVKAGYVALEASTTTQASSIMGSYAGEVQLVILDIVIPGGSGLDFANQLDVDRPGTKILYISGFVDSVAVESISRRQPDAILSKPFTGSQLLARVRDLAGSAPG